MYCIHYLSDLGLPGDFGLPPGLLPLDLVATDPSPQLVSQSAQRERENQGQGQGQVAGLVPGGGAGLTSMTLSG